MADGSPPLPAANSGYISMNLCTTRGSSAFAAFLSQQPRIAAVEAHGL